jgi:hypothetical protein
MRDDQNRRPLAIGFIFRWMGARFGNRARSWPHSKLTGTRLRKFINRFPLEMIVQPRREATVAGWAALGL